MMCLGNFTGERVRASKDRTTDRRMRTTKPCERLDDDDLEVVLCRDERAQLRVRDGELATSWRMDKDSPCHFFDVCS